MYDVVKEIVVALIEQKQIANTPDVDKNIEEVKKAIKVIAKQVVDVGHGRFD